MTDSPETSSGRLWKSVVAGAVGGLVASYAMNRFSAAVHSARDESSSGNLSQAHPAADDATVQAAQALSESLVSKPLPREEKEKLGLALHYVFGIAAGAAYGALRESFPVTSVGYGLPYGVAVWLLADEVGTPLSGLSKPPWKVSASFHASAFANHLVYGLVTDFTTRVLLAPR
jgi:hypothetical protein